MAVTTFRRCCRHTIVVVVVVNDTAATAAGTDGYSVLLWLRSYPIGVVVLVDSVVEPVGRLRVDLVVLPGAVMAVGAVGSLRRVRKLRLAAAGEVVQAPDLVPQDPADGGHGRHVVLVADPFRQESIPDLPSEDSGILLLQLPDEPDHLRGGHPRLAAADGPGQNRAGLVIPSQDFRDAAVTDPELPRDVAGPDAQLGQLDDPDPDVVGQGPPVDKDPSKLVDLPILGYL